MSDKFQVLSIDERTRLDDRGEVERYYLHTIKTAGGVTMSVDIDEADFTKDRAEPILKAKAVEADKILAL